jgi:hypothetical protein
VSNHTRQDKAIVACQKAAKANPGVTHYVEAGRYRVLYGTLPPVEPPIVEPPVDPPVEPPAPPLYSYALKDGELLSPLPLDGATITTGVFYIAGDYTSATISCCDVGDFIEIGLTPNKPVQFDLTPMAGDTPTLFGISLLGVNGDTYDFTLTIEIPPVPPPVEPLVAGDPVYSYALDAGGELIDPKPLEGAHLSRATVYLAFEGDAPARVKYWCCKSDVESHSLGGSDDVPPLVHAVDLSLLIDTASSHELYADMFWPDGTTTWGHIGNFTVAPAVTPPV